MNPLLSIRLDSAVVVVAAWGIAAGLALAVLCVPLTDRHRWRRFVVTAVLAGFAAGALVIVAAAVLVDGMDVFGGAPIDWSVRWSLAAAAALATAALMVLWSPRRWRPGVWRRTLAGALVVAALVAGGLGTNAAFGAIRTVAQLFPASVVDPTDGGVFPTRMPAAAHPIAEAAWSPPPDLPAAGTVVRADIAATVSGFAARSATIYLPPAAVVAQPPVLPVVVMLSGQPGDTGDVLTSGEFQQTLDAFAADHGGLAPIVVAPDQLSAPDRNPLCTDGPLGNSRTYLEVDVPAWIEQHLNVATDRTAWTFGGFSQGGTCTFQIGLDQPDRYGSNVAIAAELEPTLGGDGAATLAQAFGGDQAAYDAIKPLNVMASHAPYRDTLLLMGIGENDAVFSMWGDQLAAGARDAGVTVQQITSPGTSHDFNTVRFTLEQALPVLMQRAGVTT